MTTDELTYKYFPQVDDADATPDGMAVLLIYTGGTIGAVPADRDDPASPLTIAAWGEFDEGVPQLNQLREQGIRIDAIALDKPLDSTNIEPRYWSLFVEIIDRYYEQYMGFVILHGTDTMVFTASALSFMLNGLDKPVVITGSQVPILRHPHTDGTRNLVNAIRVAAWEHTGVPKVGEVCIAFDDVLLRGNRARKASADSMKGFASPNFPPLGTLDEPIAINTELLWKRSVAFNPQVTLDPRVISIQIFPGIQDNRLLDQLLGSEDLKGAVLQTYGAGNGPTSPGFLDPLEAAIESGKIIVDVTQCAKGSVRLGQYETGVGLLKRGVLSGSDLTPEAALCKLMVLLGRTELAGSVAQFVQQSRAGEQSESLYTTSFGPPEDGGRWELTDERKRLDLAPSSYDTSWERESWIASAWLHLHDALIDTNDALRCDIHFQAGPGAVGQRSFAASITKGPTAEPGLLSIDVTRGIMALEPRLPPRATILVQGSGRLGFASATLAVVVNDRTQD